jgi:hypothetical protein
MAKTNKQIEAIISELRNDHVETKPLTVDWSELMGEDMEGWTSYEALECEACHSTVVVRNTGGDEHRYIEQEDEDGNPVECMGTIHAEGPMMNYFYPCDIRDTEDAARKIAHLPLCVVEMRDGQTGLALTGGGMDLSWSICEAYIALGYLPPAHFAGSLPRFAGMKLTTNVRIILAACARSCEIRSRWALRGVEEVKAVAKWIRAEQRKRKAEGRPLVRY